MVLLFLYKAYSSLVTGRQLGPMTNSDKTGCSFTCTEDTRISHEQVSMSKHKKAARNTFNTPVWSLTVTIRAMCRSFIRPQVSFTFWPIDMWGTAVSVHNGHNHMRSMSQAGSPGEQVQATCYCIHCRAGYSGYNWPMLMGLSLWLHCHNTIINHS